MLNFISHIGSKFLKFVVDTLVRITLLATLISVAVCLVLFFLCFFTGHPVYAMLSLAGMLSFIYANKQF